MDDRKLLEDAAKAAGFGVYFDDIGQCCKARPRDPYATYLWNPLDDDGDALRLAVSLGVSVNTGRVFDVCAKVKKHGNHWVHEAIVNDDRLAATRLAIVRAAAAMAVDAAQQDPA